LTELSPRPKTAQLSRARLDPFQDHWPTLPVGGPLMQLVRVFGRRGAGGALVKLRRLSAQRARTIHIFANASQLVRFRINLR